MSRRRGTRALRAALVLAAGLAVGATPPAAAQEYPWEVGVGGTFDGYSFSDPDQIGGIETLVLVTTPFGAAVDVSERLRLEARGAWASGILTLEDGSEATLAGPTDTELRGSWSVVPDAVSLDVVAYLPTGASTLDAEEAAVAGIVALDLLPLEIAQWGTGGAVAAGLTLTRRFGDVGVGLTGSYRVSGEYEPIDETDFTYQPGNELRVRAAVDFTVGRSSKLSLAAGMRQFGEDVGNDQNLFQTGDRLEVVGTYSFPAGLRGAGALYAALVSREGGTLLVEPEGETVGQDLFLAGGLVRLPVGSHHVTPRVDARVFQPEEGGGEGYVLGAGASMDLALGGATLVPSIGGRIGTIKSGDDAESSMTGFTAGLTVRFGPGAGGAP